MTDNKIKTMTIYCGSWYGSNQKYKLAAEKLGEDLAKNNITLVHGGGMFGMMGTVANKAHSEGGNVIGITTQTIWDREHSIEFANEKTGNPLPIPVEPIFAKDLTERKRMLFEKGDALCALPGSIGTWDELFEVMVLNHVGIIKKPLIVLNLDGYYDLLYKQIEKAIEEGFTDSKVLKSFRMVEKAEDIVSTAYEIIASWE